MLWNMCFSKNIKKIGELHGRERCNLSIFFLLHFRVSHFSFHYADVPLEVTAQFPSAHPVCPAGSPPVNAENPAGFACL